MRADFHSTALQEELEALVGYEVVQRPAARERGRQEGGEGRGEEARGLKKEAGEADTGGAGAAGAEIGDQVCMSKEPCERVLLYSKETTNTCTCVLQEGFDASDSGDSSWVESDGDGSGEEVRGRVKPSEQVQRE